MKAWLRLLLILALAAPAFASAQAPQTQAPAPTCRLYASATTVNYNTRVRLDWSSQGATSGYLTDVGAIPASGSAYVVPGKNTTYAASFSGPGGVIVCRVGIAVSAGGPAVTGSGAPYSGGVVNIDGTTYLKATSITTNVSINTSGGVAMGGGVSTGSGINTSGGVSIENWIDTNGGINTAGGVNINGSSINTSGGVTTFSVINTDGSVSTGAGVNIDGSVNTSGSVSTGSGVNTSGGVNTNGSAINTGGSVNTSGSINTNGSVNTSGSPINTNAPINTTGNPINTNQPINTNAPVNLNGTVNLGGSVTIPTAPSVAPSTAAPASSGGLLGGIVPAECRGNSTVANCDLCSLAQMGQNVANFLLGITIPAAALLFAWAGILFFSSRGVPEQINRAKKIFMSVVIGFVIAVGAWVLVNTVMNGLIKGGDLKSWSWSSLNCTQTRTARLYNMSLSQYLSSSLPGLTTGGSAYQCASGQLQGNTCVDSSGKVIGTPLVYNSGSAGTEGGALGCSQYGANGGGINLAGTQCVNDEGTVVGPGLRPGELSATQKDSLQESCATGDQGSCDKLKGVVGGVVNCPAGSTQLFDSCFNSDGSQVNQIGSTYKTPTSYSTCYGDDILQDGACYKANAQATDDAASYPAFTPSGSQKGPEGTCPSGYTYAEDKEDYWCQGSGGLNDIKNTLAPGQGGGPIITCTPGSAGCGDIIAAANAYKNTDTSSGPGCNGNPADGRCACAWSVNNILQNAGIAPIDGNSVAAMEAQLKSGRGTGEGQSSAQPGDIVVFGGMSHVGICANAGCTQTLSNSSSQASFAAYNITPASGSRFYSVNK